MAFIAATCSVVVHAAAVTRKSSSSLYIYCNSKMLSGVICHLATEKTLAKVSHFPKYKCGHPLFFSHNINYSYTCVAISSMIRFVRFIIYPKQYIILK